MTTTAPDTSSPLAKAVEAVADSVELHTFTENLDCANVDYVARMFALAGMTGYAIDLLVEHAKGDYEDDGHDTHLDLQQRPDDATELASSFDGGAWEARAEDYLAGLLNNSL